MNLYVWRDPFVAVKNAKKGDPQKIGEELERLAGADGIDQLRTKDVVEAARPPRNPLHRHFEWDDHVAGAAHRRHQARQLIGSIRIKVNSNEEPTRRAFVSLNLVDGRHYRHVDRLDRHVDLQMALAQEAVRELGSMIRRYHSLSGLVPLLEQAMKAAGASAAEDLKAA